MPTPSKAYVYEIVLADLMEKINSGVISVGDKLPTEREMAKNYQVSRGSLRETLRILEENGYIKSTPGGGRVLVRNGGNSDIYDSVLTQIQHSELEDFLEAREYLDDVVVTLACKRATEEDLKRIHDTAAFLTQYYGKTPPDGVVLKDNQLHMVIASATHNRVLEAIYRMGYEYTPPIRKSTLQRAKERKSMLKEHMDIVEAILDRDELAARLASRIHNRNLRRRYTHKF
ncbi:MAG: FadR/GntR family transcriptional regulator [Lawsonibacter sp.]|jgi:GntR family transcriptional repressor for pyruvate dehydrogenase complex